MKLLELLNNNAALVKSIRNALVQYQEIDTPEVQSILGCIHSGNLKRSLTEVGFYEHPDGFQQFLVLTLADYKVNADNLKVEELFREKFMNNKPTEELRQGLSRAVHLMLSTKENKHVK